jgi:pyruvate formate lyase activating enzyme
MLSSQNLFETKRIYFKLFILINYRWRSPIMSSIPSRLKSNTVICRICGESKQHISRVLGICVDCIRERPNEAIPIINETHRKVRAQHGLPANPPDTNDGIKCGLCSNQCMMGERERGYCGLRWNEDGLKSRVSPSKGLLYTYLDPHVTNCCSAWFCPAGTGAGYPQYANLPEPEIGFYNLAVFFYGCNFDCLFCQNSSHKEFENKPTMNVESFVKQIENNQKISCICFFGGSPEPQLPFAIKASERALEIVKDRVLRICFEWNGCGEPSLVMKAAELALESGGNVKFDLKCFTPTVSLALSGVENERAYENFTQISKTYYPERPELPMQTATTLLVPGYVDAAEVEKIACFIADLDERIPYSLLVFHPNYVMNDLPITPLEQVLDCYKVATQHLERVHVGNLGLIGLRNMKELDSMAMSS